MCPQPESYSSLLAASLPVVFLTKVASEEETIYFVQVFPLKTLWRMIYFMQIFKEREDFLGSEGREDVLG